jgi:hypothetical protein
MSLCDSDWKGKLITTAHVRMRIRKFSVICSANTATRVVIEIRFRTIHFLSRNSWFEMKFRMFFSSAKWFGKEFRAFLSSAEWFRTKLHSSKCFSLLRKSSEQNSMLFLSSAEWLIPWNRCDSQVMNQHFRLFRVLRNKFFSENCNPNCHTGRETFPPLLLYFTLSFSA